MAQDEALPTELDEEDDGPVITRRPIKDTADLDITPMIDITFLLLIYFLVASVPAMQTAVELPSARYGQGVSENNSVIVTIAERGGPGSALVYLGDGTDSPLLPDDPDIQEERIVEAVRQGFNNGKPNVLLKAAKGVLHREVSRVAAAVGRVEGIKLHFAVLELN